MRIRIADKPPLHWRRRTRQTPKAPPHEANRQYAQSDLGKKRLGAWDGHDFEVVRKDPRPIRNEVMPGEGYVRIAAGNHLGEIAMHDAEESREARHLGGKQGVGGGLAEQCFGGLAALSANIPRIR